VKVLEDARAALERYYSRDRLSGDAHRLHEPLAALIAAYEEEHRIRMVLTEALANAVRVQGIAYDRSCVYNRP
jgi:hypothetical protein